MDVLGFGVLDVFTNKHKIVQLNACRFSGGTTASALVLKNMSSCLTMSHVWPTLPPS